MSSSTNRIPKEVKETIGLPEELITQPIKAYNMIVPAEQTYLSAPKTHRSPSKTTKPVAHKTKNTTFKNGPKWFTPTTATKISHFTRTTNSTKIALYHSTKSISSKL